MKVAVETFFRRSNGFALVAVCFASFSFVSHAGDLTTTNVQAGGTDWNATIWRVNGAGTAFPVMVGNTYQTVFNGTFIANSNNNTRIRNPAVAGIQTFLGTSLTLNSNTELRCKQAGAILNFPGVSGNPGLILNGGILNAGDDTTFAITGIVQVASQSYIANGRNGGGGGISAARAFNFTGRLTGAGDMVILLCGTNVPQQVSSASNNFSGQWIVQCGWLRGVGQDSLGTNNIIVDPLYTGHLAVMPSFETTNGGAWFEPGYDLNSAGSLTLTNGGLMLLHQNCAFSSATIEGVALSPGIHDYSELITNFPNSFASNGVGSITVQPYGPLPSFPPIVSQQPTPAVVSVFNKGAAKFTAVFIGTPPIAYQWRFTTNGTDYTDIPGATNTSLTLSNLQAADVGYYSLWASNSVNGDYTAGSGNAQLFVMGPAPALKPFPLSANQRGTITCLQFPSISYDIYLPPSYSTNGPPLPILYTLNAGGGGMVSAFQNVCSNLNIITVGVLNSANNNPWIIHMRDFYAVPRDIRQRVLFDPNAQFVTGVSGGGDSSYMFSRFWSQHTAGMFAMSGWMGRVFGGTGTVIYFNSDHVLTNLLVARSTASMDNPTQLGFLPYDGAFLTSCGAVVKDWTFNGTHGSAPDSVKAEALAWLVSQKTPPGPTDPPDALALAADWRSRAASGQGEAVLRECVTNLMTRPRTWFALEAQLVMDDLMTNYNTFRTLNVSNLTDGIFASEMFFNNAIAAATNADKQRYYGSLKALTGVTNPNNERAGDIYGMLKTNGYPAPIIQARIDPLSGQLNVSLQKDTPGLGYALETRSALMNDSWQSTFAFPYETNSFWSGTPNPNMTSTQGFYRVSTTLVPGTSPVWPQ